VTASLRSYVGGAIFGNYTSSLTPIVPIVALHGWGRDRSDFAALQSLSAFHSLDLPGFGSSAPPPDVWGAHEYADCVAAAVAELSPSQPVVLVGHSFGGRVALCLAASYPHLVQSLVLVGVPIFRQHGGPRPRYLFRAARRANRLRLLSDKRMDSYRYRYGSEDYRSAQGLMRRVLVKVVGEDYRAEVTHVKCPILLFWGQHDTAAPFAVAQAVADSSGAELVELDGGHDVHKTHGDQLAIILRKMQDG
jgi:pimeloyl-ACP methyl ester carboxylesterase